MMLKKAIYSSIVLIGLACFIVYYINRQASLKIPVLSQEEDFAFSDTSGFTKMLPPQPGDWLATYHEGGQTFKQYVSSNPLYPDETRNKIVLQPIGQFTDKEKEMLGKLREYTELFFRMPVILAAEAPLPQTKIGKRTRRHGGKDLIQYQTGFLMDEVVSPNLPGDAFCSMGITMTDLYPDEDWNYVFGQATLRNRVGIYSLVRYFPEFWGDPETKESDTQALRRGCSTLAHETCHMLGMEHCIFYECLVCGSNSLEESDRRPLRLCPVCLKKLHWNVNLLSQAAAIKRYEELEKFYRANGLMPEANWIKNRVSRIKAIRNNP
jgi:archaemetzincin